MSKTVKKEEQSFEKLLKRLEEINNKLEDVSIGLEEAIVLYEEGMRVSAACEKILREANAKIELVMQNEEPNEEESV